MSANMFGQSLNCNIKIQGGYFIVEENFTVGNFPKSPVIIGSVSNRFKDFFFGKTEYVSEGTKYLLQRGLIIPGTGRQIFLGVGGEKKADIFVAEIFGFFKNQCAGIESPLNTRLLVSVRPQPTYHCHANLFVAKDKEDEFRMVQGIFYDSAWHFDAYGINDRGKWPAGAKIFNRV